MMMLHYQVMANPEGAVVSKPDGPGTLIVSVLNWPGSGPILTGYHYCQGYLWCTDPEMFHLL